MNKEVSGIFRYIAKYPVVQIVSVLLFVSAAYIIAANTQIGSYLGFYATVQKANSGYYVDIPQEYISDVSAETPGKWTFDQEMGKRYNIIFSEGKYMLDTQKLRTDEVAYFDKLNNIVYVEFRVGASSMLGG